jgi:hypothetical protein
MRNGGIYIFFPRSSNYDAVSAFFFGGKAPRDGVLRAAISVQTHIDPDPLNRICENSLISAREIRGLFA